MKKSFKFLGNKLKQIGHIDVNERDFPVVFIDKKYTTQVYFGKPSSTHTQLINDILQTTTVEDYCREPYESEEDILFGHAIGKNIIIDTYMKSLEEVFKICKKINKCNYFISIYCERSNKIFNLN